MKRTWIFLLTAAAALIVAGSDPLNLLPYTREIDTVVLMRTLGVDRTAEGVAVTVSAGAENNGPPEVLSGTGDSLSGALLTLQGQGESYLFYGHVGQLLLGADGAQTLLRPALDYVLRDVEMRLDTDLYVVRGGSAGAAIRGAAGPGRSAADRLEAIAEDAGLLSATMTRTVGQVLNDLALQGAALIPALRAEGDSMEPAGYAICRGDALVGWAEGEAAKGVNLLLGEVDADILETEWGTLRLVDARCRVRPVFTGDALTGIEVRCRVEANLAEGDPARDLSDERWQRAAERELEDRTEARLRAALELVQRLDADYPGLRQQVLLARPWRKAELTARWDLPSLTLTVQVEGRVERGYDVAR